jgi:hypothetical protein
MHGRKTLPTLQSVRSSLSLSLIVSLGITPWYLPASTYPCVIAAYPYSRGTIHINTPDATATDGYDFDAGFLNDKDEVDVAIQVWAYKKMREIYRRTTKYRGELPLGHPTFPEGSKAGLVDLRNQDHSLEGEIPDLEYSLEDDAALRSSSEDM